MRISDWSSDVCSSDLEWHAWLHHTTDAVPPEGGPDRHPWQKDHQPNLTGTVQAYRPPGHTLKGGRRAPATGDYEPWTPNRSEEHTSELQSLMRISYAVFCLKKKTRIHERHKDQTTKTTQAY